MKKFVAVLSAAAMMTSLAACGYTADTANTAASSAETTASAAESTADTAAADSYKVAIVQQLDHASLDEIRVAIEKELGAKAAEKGITIEYKDFNGQNDATTLNQIGTQVVADGYDAIIPIATLAAQCMTTAAESTKTPVIYAAISDPAAADLTDIDYVTGTSDALNTQSIMDMMFAVQPDIQTVGLLYCSAEPNSQYQVDVVQKCLEDMGYTIEASHHEVAEGQHEIDFQFGDVMLSADRVMTFKHVVKTYAAKHGLHATFMPKPIYGINGSGMHTNMSLYYLKDGKNAFDDPNGEMGLSEAAYNFIAGIMAHIRGIAAFSNPTVNSYKRLVPGYEAPSYLVWSASNRSCLVRIPAARGKGTRVELRCPDPTCNPYLEMALCLAAGLDGIKNKMTPASPIDYNVFGLSDEELKAAGIDCLPGSLKEAIDAAKADPFIKETLGDHVFNNYIEGKENEWDEYRTKVSQWEIDKYMVLY